MQEGAEIKNPSEMTQQIELFETALRKRTDGNDKILEIKKDGNCGIRCLMYIFYINSNFIKDDKKATIEKYLNTPNIYKDDCIEGTDVYNYSMLLRNMLTDKIDTQNNFDFLFAHHLKEIWDNLVKTFSYPFPLVTIRKEDNELLTPMYDIYPSGTHLYNLAILDRSGHFDILRVNAKIIDKPARKKK